MELLKEAVKVEKLICKLEEQALVEGDISLPSGKSDIDNVLLLDGNVTIGSTEVLDGSILMDGVVVFHVIYKDAQGNIDSFESSSMFKHNIDAKEALAGMDGITSAQIQQVEYTLTDARDVSANAVVNLCFTITQQEEIAVISGIEGEDDLQRIDERASIPVIERSSGQIEISDDIMLSQGLPGVVDILGYRGFARIRSLRAEPGRVLVEGETKFLLIYGSGEENPIQSTMLTLPFNGVIEFDEIDGDSKVYAVARLSDIYITASEDGGRLLNIDCVVNIDAVAVRRIEYCVIKDCYSLTNEVIIDRKTLESREIAAYGNGKCAVKENMLLPDGMPEIARVANTSANAVITAQKAAYGKTEIEGILFLGIVYITEEEQMRSLNVQTAFSGELDINGVQENMDLMIDLEIETAYVSGRGKDIDIRVILDACVIGYANSTMEVITDMRFEPKQQRVDGGITIYFASAGETLWSVAKRFNTKVDTIHKYNPEIKDDTCLNQGQKLLLYRPYAC